MSHDLTPEEMEAEDATRAARPRGHVHAAGRSRRSSTSTWTSTPRWTSRPRSTRASPQRERGAPGGRGRLGQRPVGGCAGGRDRAADLRDRPDASTARRRRSPTRIPTIGQGEDGESRRSERVTHDRGTEPLTSSRPRTAEGLPERAAMSSIPPLPGTRGAGARAGLLDLDVNVDLSADAAAPIGAAVAANANVAAPIDAAVAANVASPDATAAASAPQTSDDHPGPGRRRDRRDQPDVGHPAGRGRRGRVTARLAAALATISICAAPAGVAQAAPAHDNTATATVEKDGARAFDFEWSLLRERGGVVDHQQRRAGRCPLRRLPGDGDRLPGADRRGAAREARALQPGGGGQRPVHALRRLRRRAPARAGGGQARALHREGCDDAASTCAATCARSSART